MGDKEELLKKKMFNINITKQQQNEDYYLNRDLYTAQAMEESQMYMESQSANEQKIKEAEKVAGLSQKTIPAEEVPAEVLKQMEEEYASIHKGKKLSGKAKSKLKKEYLRKQRQSASAQKIFDARQSVSDGMASFLKKQTKLVTGKEKIEGHERKNSAAVAHATIMNGQSMVHATYAMRSLSINMDKATDEQLNDKAVETERILKVIMNYDMKKLKYNNSDEFLANLGEKLTITRLAMECDNLLTDYRQLKAKGKILKPLPDEFINEAQARVGALTTISTRIEKKAIIMKSPFYSLISEDSIKKLSLEEAVNRIAKYGRMAADPKLSEQERKMAKEKSDYYEAVMSIKNMEENTKDIDKFGRGDDPEKLLELNRKEVNKEHPPKEADEAYDEEVFHTEEYMEAKTMAEKYNVLVDEHVDRKKLEQSASTYMGEKAAIDIAKFITAPNMAFLKENPALRHREIRRYYARCHAGENITKDVFDKIEKDFETKFTEAEKLSEATATVDEVIKLHHKRANEFAEYAKKNDPEFTHSRQADEYLALLDDKTMEEKKACYDSYNAIYKDDSNDANLSVEDKKRIVKGVQPIVDFVLGFDINKLEFTNMSELFGRYKEVAPFLNNIAEMQNFPKAYLKVGDMDEDTWVELQARVLMGLDLTWLIKTKLAIDSSGVRSLIDDEEMANRQIAYNVRLDRPQDVEKSGYSVEYIKKSKSYLFDINERTGCEENSPELNQLLKNLQEYKGMMDTSYYHPGSKMDVAMEKYRANAKKSWDKLHA